jgi:fermentation-respiration switch protein FrsA (DUF1100 family)
MDQGIAPVVGVDMEIDVTGPAGFGEDTRVFARVRCADPSSLRDRPVVAFLRPGAGFSHGYFTEALPGRAESQAEWHASRGWIVVSIDHLGLGASTRHDVGALTFARVARAGDAADRTILERLSQGSLIPGLGPVRDVVSLGVGHSIGGCLTVVQQAHHRTWDGVAVLGFSVVQPRFPVPPGEPTPVLPWVVRGDGTDGDDIVLNQHEVDEAEAALVDGSEHPLLKWHNWQFYGDEVDPSGFVDASRWSTDVYPGLVRYAPTPGVIAPEAAALRCPVLLASGDRDLVGDLRSEVDAYRSATSIDLFTCPHTAHMHNFSTRAPLLWRRLHRWGDWVRDLMQTSDHDGNR